MRTLVKPEKAQGSVRAKLPGSAPRAEARSKPPRAEGRLTDVANPAPAIGHRAPERRRAKAFAPSSSRSLPTSSSRSRTHRGLASGFERHVCRGRTPPPTRPTRSFAVGLHRARQPADAKHPFGHGRERFLWPSWPRSRHFWSAAASSIGIAIKQPRARATRCPPALRRGSFSRLRSWRTGRPGCRACRQARHQAKDYGSPSGAILVRASDPVVRAVFVEDSAALIGSRLAASGLLLTGTLLHRAFRRHRVALDRAAPRGHSVRAGPSVRGFSGWPVDPPAQLELHAIFKEDAAIEEVLSLQAVYGARRSDRRGQGPSLVAHEHRAAQPGHGRPRPQDPACAAIRCGRVYRRDGVSRRTRS